MSKLKVVVCSDDIRYGSAANPTRCPIANSIRRTSTDDVFVDVGGLIAKVYNPATKDLVVYQLPTEARVFVRRFDNGLPVEPIVFDMEEVKEYGPSPLEKFKAETKLVPQFHA